MDAHEIEAALEHAINALGLAKIALSKSALPVFSQSDELRKSDLTDQPRASTAMQRGDIIIKRTQDAMDDLNARMAVLEADRDAKMPAYTIAGGQS
jgi:hypothetical protein